MTSRLSAFAVSVTMLLAAFALLGGSTADAAQTDEGIANSGLVVQTDLPAGYVPSTDDSDGPDLNFDKMAKTIPSCKALAALAALDSGKKSGKDETEDEGT